MIEEKNEIYKLVYVKIQYLFKKKKTPIGVSFIE